MAPVSASKVLSLAVLLTSVASGTDPFLITGVLHEDVLLPCHGAYTGDFRLDLLVINWQRLDSDEVLHSYFHESDQPQYQAEEFKGRTQLFPAEFPKGNASLLLKNLRASDAGHYTCHWILSDKESYAPQQVELLAHGSDSFLITGVLHGDVLLPCHGSFTGDFRLDLLVINWQRSDSDEVLHSYFHESDQPQYQAEEFKGRTQLFPAEFPKGNASLLLKNLRSSDAGHYTCHCIIDSKDSLTPQHVELAVHGEGESRSQEKNSWLLYLLFSVPVAVIAAAAVFIVLRRKQKRKTPQDPIESYKSKVLGSSVRHRKALSSGDNETDNFLPRRFHSMGSKKCSEDIEDDLSYRCEGNECKVQSEDLFTLKPSKLISRRMLITGTAGFGKSCFSNELQRQWASRREVYYRCIILLSVSELNTIKEPISVIELLELKCPELSDVLPELLNAERVLIILDGLDEFNHKLDVSPPSPHSDSGTPQLRVSPRSPHWDIDTPLSIRSLLSKVISKQLLPSTDVLVTSEFNYVSKITNYFSSTFILEAFTEDQIQEYYNNLMAGGDISKSFADYIETHNVSRLVSIPLIGSALCEIYREASTPGDVGALTTCSSVIFCLFQITVSNTLAKMGSWGHLCCAASTTEESGLPETITNTIHQLCEMSYKNIITGVQEIKRKELAVNCRQAEDLLRSLRGFFFREESKTDRYVYRHSSIRDMFAALHCVEKIQDEEELEECLDTWALEMMPNNARSPLLEGITAHHGKRFQSFLRFFFGLLTSGKQSFLSQPKPLSYKRNEFLKKWFQAWIEMHPIEIELLNLFHYVFELHDDYVTQHVSGCIKSVDLFNTSLNSLDIHALLYCCERSQLDVVDLRLCELGDSGLKQMKSILRSSKKAYLSSNNLTAESGKLLGDLLEDEACAIENLVLGTNALGNEGAVQVFRGLGKNKRLIKLSLNDNNISTLDKKTTALSLKSNQTLQELRLCMNLFRNDEIEKIRDLQNDRPKLKIVMRITEDEGVFHYTEEKVEMLSRKWKEYDASWVLGILNKVKGDLKYANLLGPHLGRVEKLEAKIKELKKQLSCEHIGSSLGTSKM